MKFHLYSYGQLKFWYHNNLITKLPGGLSSTDALRDPRTTRRFTKRKENSANCDTNRLYDKTSHLFSSEHADRTRHFNSLEVRMYTLQLYTGNAL